MALGLHVQRTGTDVPHERSRDPQRPVPVVAVRSRPVEVVLLVGVGVLLTAFALAIPGA